MQMPGNFHFVRASGILVPPPPFLSGPVEASGSDADGGTT